MVTETIASIEEKLKDPVVKRLEDRLSNLGFEDLPQELMMIAYKKERLLKVYGINSEKPVLIKSYPFTTFSGKQGPKLEEGDLQIPEGIYRIESFNPNSAFYLSLKINYPNNFDLEMAEKEGRSDPGSNIFIHGKNQSTGCIAIGDRAIEEVFILASTARTKPIKVIIAPSQAPSSEWKEKNLNYPTWVDGLYASIGSELQEIQELAN